jgi:hypothetical protein
MERMLGSLHKFIRLNRMELEKRLAQHEARLSASVSSTPLSQDPPLIPPSDDNHLKPLPLTLNSSPSLISVASAVSNSGMMAAVSNSGMMAAVSNSGMNSKRGTESQLFTFSNASLNITGGAGGVPVDSKQLQRHVDELRQIFNACDLIEQRIQAKK